VAARLAELDMVAADLTRANERVATVERRNVRAVPAREIYVLTMFRSCFELRLNPSAVGLHKRSGEHRTSQSVAHG
jgi:hypothetical protein